MDSYATTESWNAYMDHLIGMMSGLDHWCGYCEELDRMD